MITNIYRKLWERYICLCFIHRWKDHCLWCGTSVCSTAVTLYALPQSRGENVLNTDSKAFSQINVAAITVSVLPSVWHWSSEKKKTNVGSRKVVPKASNKCRHSIYVYVYLKDPEMKSSLLDLVAKRKPGEDCESLRDFWSVVASHSSTTEGFKQQGKEREWLRRLVEARWFRTDCEWCELSPSATLFCGGNLSQLSICIEDASLMSKNK